MRDRSYDISMFEDTMQILKQGWYEKNGRKFSLKLSAADIQSIQVCLPVYVKAICNTPEFKPTAVESGTSVHTCENIDSYAMARRRLAEGCSKILVLNLASPVHPGGGVRRGARAQEEDLCRKSSLLLSLESKAARKYYDYNKSLHSFMGSDALMITPQVEIIKDENGVLLDDTDVVSVLTCAAPKVSNGKEGMKEMAYRELVYNRITGIVKCAAYFGYTNLVLGAWGCGAYGNDASVISDLFRRALNELDYNSFQENDLFSRIDFAVLDRTASQFNYNQFKRNFGTQSYHRS